MLKVVRHNFERDYIRGVLSATDWNMSKAAKVLGIERSHLYRMIKTHAVTKPKVGSGAM